MLAVSSPYFVHGSLNKHRDSGMDILRRDILRYGGRGEFGRPGFCYTEQLQPGRQPSHPQSANAWSLARMDAMAL
jgi:hypothetical protein